MPVKEVYLTITRPKHKFRYRLVATQLGIVAGVFAIYKLLRNMFGLELSNPAPTDSIMFYSLLPVLISFGLLLIILISVGLRASFRDHQNRLQKAAG